MTDGIFGEYTLCEKREKQDRHQLRGNFQGRVTSWMLATFGPEITDDTQERNHRFLEESLELVQACGCTASEAHQLVDYVFNRPVGEKSQEVGGVMVTLAALCLAQGLSMYRSGWDELDRCWENMDKIRAKQAAKPKHSPLPVDEPGVITITIDDHNEIIRADRAADAIRKHIARCVLGEDWEKELWKAHPLYEWGQRKIGRQV